MKKRVAIFGIILMLAGSALAKEKAAKLSTEDLAKRQAAIQNTRIVPGRSVGSIRLGMGMDEVSSILGKPDFNYGDSSTPTTWKYISINLMMTFSSGAAPNVTSVTASGWSHGSTKMGDVYWKKNVEAPVVNYSTDTGVTLGSTSFAAVRAYAGNEYEDHTVWITLKKLGLQLIISMDHVVYGITVQEPQ